VTRHPYHTELTDAVFRLHIIISIECHLYRVARIGVILGETVGPDPPLFGVGGQTPPYKYTKSEILLGPLTFQTKVTPLVAQKLGLNDPTNSVIALKDDSLPDQGPIPQAQHTKR